MGGLVLAGHTDTVPFDEALWQSDPFTIKDDPDRYYGLGSCDMKGFFPVALEAAATFANQPLSAPLTVVATSDEESSMAGDVIYWNAVSLRPTTPLSANRRPCSRFSRTRASA